MSDTAERCGADSVSMGINAGLSLKDSCFSFKNPSVFDHQTIRSSQKTKSFEGIRIKRRCLSNAHYYANTNRENLENRILIGPKAQSNKPMPGSHIRHMSLEVEDCHFTDENSIIEVQEQLIDDDVIGRRDLRVEYTPED